MEIQINQSQADFLNRVTPNTYDAGDLINLEDFTVAVQLALSEIEGME